MLVRMGNPRPHTVIDGKVVIPDVGGHPVVFSCQIPLHEGSGYSVTMGDDVNVLARHLATHTGMVTHLGEGHEAFLAITKAWTDHCDQPATWVDVVPEAGEDPTLTEDFERQIAEFFEADRKAPADVEETHHTSESAPPGVDSGLFATSSEG